MTLRVAYAIPLSLAVFTLPASATDAVGIAGGLIGKPYVWGAEGPRAFDCSGLTQYVYQKVGIDLPRRAVSQSQIGDARLLLMVSLVVADELSDAFDEIKRLRAELEGQGGDSERKAAAALEQVARRVEAIAAELERT